MRTIQNDIIKSITDDKWHNFSIEQSYKTEKFRYFDF